MASQGCVHVCMWWEQCPHWRNLAGRQHSSPTATTVHAAASAMQRSAQSLCPSTSATNIRLRMVWYACGSHTYRGKCRCMACPCRCACTRCGPAGASLDGWIADVAWNAPQLLCCVSRSGSWQQHLQYVKQQPQQQHTHSFSISLLSSVVRLWSCRWVSHKRGLRHCFALPAWQPTHAHHAAHTAATPCPSTLKECAGSGACYPTTVCGECNVFQSTVWGETSAGPAAAAAKQGAGCKACCPA